MAVPKANQRAVNKYVKNNYDRVNVTMPKGKKAAIQAHAEAHGESVNGFINRAIDQTMSRDDLEASTAGSAGGVVVYSEGAKAAPAASDGSVEVAADGD